MDGIIDQSRLLGISGLKNKAALRKHLRRAGIPFKELNGRLFTTQSALDAAMVGHAKSKRKEPNFGALDGD